MQMLTSTPAVIEVLGGNTKVAKIVKTGSKAVSNWKRHKKFPANSYLVLKAALAANGLDAPDRLWAMRQVPKGLKNGR